MDELNTVDMEKAERSTIEIEDLNAVDANGLLGVGRIIRARRRKTCLCEVERIGVKIAKSEEPPLKATSRQ